MDVDNILSDDEVDRLIVATCQARPASEEDIGRVVSWARETRLQSVMLDLVLKGDLVVHVENGELEFMAAQGR